MPHGPLELDALTHGLAVRTIGRRIELHPDLPSTNQRALDCLRDEACHGRVVLAESQSQGRGRLARTWYSPRGGSILLSVVLVLPPRSPSARTLLLWSAIAACEAAERAAGVRPAIKWPNDLYVGQRKLCGVLIESRPLRSQRGYALGIGMNCLQHPQHFPPEIRERATSLDIESAAPVNRLAVARCLIERLDAWLSRSAERDVEDVKQAWLEHCEPLGTRLHLETGGRRFSGTLVEVDPEAGILMELEHGGRRLFDPLRTSVVKDGADP